MSDHSPNNRRLSHFTRDAKRRSSPGLWPLASGPRRYRYRPPRRGVLLLVVLTVLVLFVMLTVTYVIVATKERTLAKYALRVDQSGDPPNQVLDSLAMTVFRGSNDVHCPIASWDLLGGIYGNVSFRGQIGSQYGALDSSGASPSTTHLPNYVKTNYDSGGQFFFIGLDPDSAGNTVVWINSGTKQAPFNLSANYYKGCVLTMITGPCAGCSARIVGSTGRDTTNSVNAGLTVMRFKSDAAVDANGKLLDPGQGDWFVVNGPAYAGMGRGYDPSYKPGQPAPASQAPNGLNFHDPVDNADRPYALLPNYAGILAAAAAGGNYVDPTLYGGENVDYTAYDHNSVYLGLVTNYQTPPGATPEVPAVLPSFHRPVLCKYWFDKLSGNITPNLARQILFRPNKFDHPVFWNTTNPTFDPTNAVGPYDVDNIGAGTPDSIWIDPGLPVMTAKDGRTYKILVAPLILDLDGRLNVNAHGSYTLIDPSVNYQGGMGDSSFSTASTSIAGVGRGNPATLFIGEGYGPAEVNLLKLFSHQEVDALLRGNATNQGRHGAQYSSTASEKLVGVKYFEYPLDDYRNALNSSAQAATSFLTPPDLKGRRMLALDPCGRPLFLTNWPSRATDPYNDSIPPGGTLDNNLCWQNEVYGNSSSAPDSPYGFDLSAPKPGRQVPTGLDNPFTVAELERVLRAYDIDAKSLPPRLASMVLNNLASSPDPNRGLHITTDSYDVPVPSLALPPSSFTDKTGAGTTSYREIAQKNFTSNPQGQYRAFQLSDFVRFRLSQTAMSSASAAAIDAEVTNLLPAEILAGLKMDINRPFGNGRDDFDGNNAPKYGVDGVADQVSNTPQPNVVQGLDYTKNVANGGLQEIKPPTYPTSVPFNITNGNGANDPLLSNKNIPVAWKARQLMARHLYVLMMLFTDQGFVTWTTETNLTPAQQKELTARRVAQWAINAVCFRDATSAMTPFEYHSDVFASGYAGWSAKGDLTDVTAPGDANDNKVRVVWGCKPPELVLSETLAFHDFRVADTTFDDDKQKKTTDNKDPDLDFDQIEVPQGSAFFKLYCCRNPNNPAAPADLYDYDANLKQWSLNLGRMTPDNNWPIWRLGISESSLKNPNVAQMMDQVGSHPDTVVAESAPGDPGVGPFNINLSVFNSHSTNAKPNEEIHIERVVWLGSSPPPAGSRAGVFYNRNSQYNAGSNLLPGNYALICPRAVTHVGSMDPKAAGPYGVPAPQRIALSLSNQKLILKTYQTANNSSAYDNATPPASAPDKRPIGIIAAADPPPKNDPQNPWTNASHQQYGIGLNISEPLPVDPSLPVGTQSQYYYPEPTIANSNDVDPLTNQALIEAYGDLTAQNAAQRFKDHPLDLGGESDADQRPLHKEGLDSTGTKTNYKTVFLQRLADPSLPFNTNPANGPINPYITVDWMPIDLSRFNGEDKGTVKYVATKGVNASTADRGKNADVLFATRQRGGSDSSKKKTPPIANPWTSLTLTDTLPPPQQGPTTGVCFSTGLEHALGFLNQSLGPAFGIGTGGNPPLPQYWGDPAAGNGATNVKPFPWITWNARPYGNLIELLLVPASSPDRLFMEFGTPSTGTTQQTNAYYGTAAGAPQPNASGDGVLSRFPYGHLLNFINSADQTNAPGKASNFYRVLDYLRVPSRFVGTETVLNPKVFTANNMAFAGFLPPFNTVSNYRDPGLVNINTLTSSQLWDAVRNGFGPNYEVFKLNRNKSYTQASQRGATFPGSGSGTVQTEWGFAAPFRSAACADLAPLPGMMRSGIEATLLRPDSGGTLPLFGAHDSNNWLDDGQAGHKAQTVYNDSARNPYFAYQGAERISNLVTTRSNVFAVWLTIGYFEVLPWPQAGINQPPGGAWTAADYAAHADGYQLGAELGSDTGEVVRHRAFYIFDRSIPVGYERGQNHNVNRAILLRRYIE